jgi:hypothetical protein
MVSTITQTETAGGYPRPYKFAPKKPDVFDYDQKILLRDFEKGLAER